MNKPRYRVKRIQDIKTGDAVYDNLHGGHLIAESNAFQEGKHQGLPVWKFMYSRSYNILAHKGWATEGTQFFVYLGKE